MAQRRPRLKLIEGGGAPVAPSSGPPLELAAAGTGLVLVSVLLARLPSWRAELGTFQSLFVVAFAFYALAVLRRRRARDSRHAGLVVLVVAAAARLALVPVTPTLSDDVYRYVWEGRVAAAGHDPWRESPDAPSLAPLRDRTIHPRINHPELASVYPPLAVAGFALVARISPTVPAMKLWVIVHDLALILLLLAWGRARQIDPAWVAVYAWNPLVLVEVAGSGHAEPTALFWLVAALGLATRRPVVSALALAAGALVKLAPLAALPALLRGWTLQARATAALAIAVGLTLFFLAARGANSGVGAYAWSWRHNELGFLALEALAGEAPARAIALAATVLAGVVLAGRRTAIDATRATLKLGLLLAPVVHPWYLGWALALEPMREQATWRAAPWVLLSLTSILSYGVLAPPAEGGAFHPSLGVRLVEYGLPALLALGLAWRHRRGRT